LIAALAAGGTVPHRAIQPLSAVARAFAVELLSDQVARLDGAYAVVEDGCATGIIVTAPCLVRGN
jgi:hypothetical protein